MALNSPTVSQIRSANQKAVGGGRKRCQRGKNCSATCIHGGDECLVGLSENVGISVSKVRDMLTTGQEPQGIVNRDYPLGFLRGQKAEKASEKLEEFEKHLEKYNPNARQFFRDTLNGALKGLLNTPDKEGEDRDRYALRVLTNITVLAKDGPPTKIHLKDGTPVEVSAHIYPVLSKTGNMAWKDPVQNVSFTKRGPGDMDLEQNRVTAAASLANGQLRAVVKFHETWNKSPDLLKKGAFGTSQAAKLREVTNEEVENFWKALPPGRKKAFQDSGLDQVGNRKDDRSSHRAFYEKYPEELEWRGKQVALAYLRQTPSPGQTAISPWTGLPILMPGERGLSQSVIDHDKPISKFFPNTGKAWKPWTKEEGIAVIRKADMAANFVVGESGINNGKGASEDWNKLTKNWARNLDKFEKHLKEVDKLPTFGVKSVGNSLINSATPSEAPASQLRQTRVRQERTVRLNEREVSPRQKTQKIEKPVPRVADQEKQIAELKQLVVGYRSQGFKNVQIMDELKKLGIRPALVQEVLRVR